MHYPGKPAKNKMANKHPNKEENRIKKSKEQMERRTLKRNTKKRKRKEKQPDHNIMMASESFSWFLPQIKQIDTMRNWIAAADADAAVFVGQSKG